MPLYANQYKFTPKPIYKNVAEPTVFTRWFNNLRMHASLALTPCWLHADGALWLLDLHSNWTRGIGKSSGTENRASPAPDATRWRSKELRWTDLEFRAECRKNDPSHLVWEERSSLEVEDWNWDSSARTGALLNKCPQTTQSSPRDTTDACSPGSEHHTLGTRENTTQACHIWCTCQTGITC